MKCIKKDKQPSAQSARQEKATDNVSATESIVLVS